MNRLLLCTDLDRTLLPNGAVPESPNARERFAEIAALPGVTLAYVTGRHRELVDEAVATWCIPEPDLLITDVGATIAARVRTGWERWTRWDRKIATDWSSRRSEDLQPALLDLPELTLQEPSRQSRFKLSYTVPQHTDGSFLIKQVRRRLDHAGVSINIIWSLDEVEGVGLLDILPSSAGKRQAIEFVMSESGYRSDQVLFAGDSGNDLDVLASMIPAVLVANADPGLRDAARQKAAAAGWGDTLYCARGGLLGMNGNYAAGILEGLVHFHPGLRSRLEGAG